MTKKLGDSAPTTAPQKKALLRWIKSADVKDVERLCELAGLSPAYLSSLARGHKAKKKGGDALMASRVEAASRILAEETEGRTRLLYKSDVCRSCADCEYLRACVPEAMDPNRID